MEIINGIINGIKSFLFGEKTKSNHRIYKVNYLKPLYLGGMEFHSEVNGYIFLTEDQYEAVMAGSSSIQELGLQLSKCKVRIIDPYEYVAGDRIQVNTAFCLCPSCHSK